MGEAAMWGVCLVVGPDAPVGSPTLVGSADVLVLVDPSTLLLRVVPGLKVDKGAANGLDLDEAAA